MYERWYPLTAPGAYTAGLEVIPSAGHEHCAVDLAPYRGITVGICAAGGICALTDDNGGLLGRWDKAPAELNVPENAGTLYLTNCHTENPDFYITVPAGARKKPGGLLFYEEFTGTAPPDPNDFVTLTGQRTQEGLVLPVGMEHALVVNKSTALDDWSMSVEFTVPDGETVLWLGSRITQPHNCRHATLCCADFAAGELRLYPGSNGHELPERVLQAADITAVTKGNRDFRLRTERIDSAIRVSLTGLATGTEAALFEGLIPDETATSVAGACRAGKLFDSPQLFVTGGQPTIRRFYASCKTTPRVMFFGDSLTQGAHNLPRDGWAQMSAAYFGNSLCCGRGSGDIWSCLNQVRSLVPVCRPKAMVVTIGANNSADVTASLYEKFIRMAEYWGVILILNCVPACDKRPAVRIMNGYLQRLPALKCRFDLVTRRGSCDEGEQIPEYYVADQTHLNGQGNRALYRRFISDFAWLKDL